MVTVLTVFFNIKKKKTVKFSFKVVKMECITEGARGYIQTKPTGLNNVEIEIWV